MKIAMVQMDPELGKPENNIRKVNRFLREAAGADLVVLPELANSGYNFKSADQAHKLAEPVNNSRFIDAISKSCYLNNNFVVTGFNEKEDKTIYSSAILIGPNGVEGIYRKIHLFWNEKDHFTKGNLGLPVCDIGICKVGMLVCFDWIFPEVWRILAMKGADIICHPSNLVLPFAQQAVPATCLINRIFGVTVNRVGTEGDLTFTGKSFVADPTGKILSSASDNKEEVLMVSIDILKARDKMVTPRNHVFNDRLPEEYQEIVGRPS